MVLRIDTSDHSQQPLTASSSLSSEDDLEGGNSSQEDNTTEIVSKFIPMRAGKPTRRLSQCKQLTFRQRSEPSIDQQQQRRRSQIPAPASHPSTSRRWSTLVTSNNSDLPKTIQFYPSSDQQSPSQSKKSHLLLTTTIVILAIIGSSITVYLQHAQLTAVRQELQITNQHRQYMEKSRSTLLTQLANREKSLDQYRHTHEQVTKVNHDMSESMRKLRQDHTETVKELERLRAVEKRVNWSEGRWEKYVEGVQERSRRIAVEKFGKGPHHVELQVQLPSSSSSQETTELQTIKIELAPLDMMPHSVHTFLEQVHQGSWDGTAFDVHAGHVLMARPSSSSSPNTEQDHQHQAPTPTVMIPEYSARYPHDKYTIAFPGSQTPSSPSQDFYINLQPNSIHHSPRIETVEKGGGGRNSEVYVEGEPCFGKIVDEESRRVVDRMDGLSMGERGLLKERVVIKSARIVGGYRD